MTWVPKKKVLVPTDLSDGSLAAIDVGLSLVAAPSGLHVLHVLPSVSPSERLLMTEAYESNLRRKHAADLVRENLADPAYAGVNIDIGVGDPGEEIANFAKLWKIELIVMPSHGRRGMSRLLIGSVAERVTRLAPCPVLILRE